MIATVTLASWACPLVAWLGLFVGMFAYARWRGRDRW